MPEKDAQTATAHLVKPDDVEVYDVLGPAVQFLTPPVGEDWAPCVMRGTIPPGVVIPLHSHPDPETFIAISGEVEGLVYVAADDVAWVRIAPGAVFHVPGQARHAFRNLGAEPAVMDLISTARIGRFFQEVGMPRAPGSAPPGPPSPQELEHFLATAARYGHWSASPEENARVGIALPLA